MHIVLISRTLDAALRRAFEGSGISIDSLETLDRIAARETVLERPPDLLVIECEGAGAIELIKEVRASSGTLPIIAVGAGANLEDAAAAGADDTLEAGDLKGRIMARAVRYAFLIRRTRRSQLQLLESMQQFGESLALEAELDGVVKRVVDQMIASTSAEIGLLVCDLEWRGISGRVTALRGADLAPDKLEPLATSPALSPLRNEPGIRALEPGALDSRFDELGPVASVMTVPLSRGASWGRGGVALASSRVNAFGEHDLQIATALAAWAGVALLHTNALVERNHAIEIRERVLAVASHDLRTPLSVLNMAIELLSDTSDPGERKSLAARAERAVKSMKRLIGDLMDFAAVDAGQLRIEIGNSSGDRIARRAIAAVEPDAERAGIELALEIEDEDLSLEVDAGRIEQALNNILGNGVKFTQKGGRVELRVRGGANTVVFSVTDNGPGIPEEKQRQLFERYTTSSRAGTGIGLGLSIARGIVEHHGGTLVVESTPGEGSTFLISLPRVATRS